MGNPLDFFLTPGQTHDLEGADALLPGMAAETLLADKASDADERVIKPLLARGKSLVIPPKSNRKIQRDYDKDAIWRPDQSSHAIFALGQERRVEEAVWDAGASTNSRLSLAVTPM